MRFETAALGDICRIIPGFPFKSRDFHGTHKVIKTGNLNGGELDTAALPLVSADAYDPELMARYLARKGDCLIPVLGTGQGHRKVSLAGEGEAYINQGVVLLRAGPEVEGEYLYQLLRREELWREAREALGGRTPYVSAKALRRVPVPLPPREEQRSVVRMLKLLEERRELYRRIKENLDAQAEHIFRSWFELYEPFGGTCPDGWPVVPLTALTAYIGRGVLAVRAEEGAAAEYRVIHQKCIRDHELLLSRAAWLRGKDFGKKRLQYGDILINSAIEGTQGRTAQVLFEPHKLTVHRYVTIVRPAREELTFYLGQWAKTKEEELACVNQGRGTQQELPCAYVRAMALRLPDRSTLEKFNACLVPVLSCRQAATDEMETLERWQQRLLTQFLNSKTFADQ